MMNEFNKEELKQFVDDNKPAVIEHYIIECKDDCRFKLEDIRTLERGKDLFESLSIHFNEKEYEEAHSLLNEKHENAVQYHKNVEDALKEKQSQCEHSWKYDGHDSHYEYYYCEKCGATDRW